MPSVNMEQPSHPASGHPLTPSSKKNRYVISWLRPSKSSGNVTWPSGPSNRYSLSTRALASADARRPMPTSLRRRPAPRRPTRRAPWSTRPAERSSASPWPIGVPPRAHTHTLVAFALRARRPLQHALLAGAGLVVAATVRRTPEPTGGVILLVLLSWVVYLTPTFVALIRRSPRLAAVFAINLLLGWTAIGWIVALVLALQPSGTRPPRPDSVATT